MMVITANELKRRGISFVSRLLDKWDEVYVSVRGNRKFVILKAEEYERLKEIELEKAIQDAEKDLEEGKYVVETAEEHIKRLGI